MRDVLSRQERDKERSPVKIELRRQEYNGSEETEEERDGLTGERITESVIKK